ncbi:HK97 gp10 family phage protein [Desulfuromonas thiophila]|uniref:Phage protein, HK97 gp10 family n=1 Tax=Desulfuromonas thiophila TaxID=57664 RepID=A0A1G7B3S2_9BACT|nr:HK97 gp10 family phage protein [Desulfuromonas thiophila]SDE20936.1 phage protein, HK97 gp10 family [Desulfuromonas thiophila]
MSNFRLDWNGAQLTAEVRGECREAIREGAEAIATDARRLCPVDSGELKNTIEVATWEKPDAIGAYVKAGGDKLGHVARFVELGTPGTTYRAGKRKGKSRRPIKAKPYLRPSLKRNRTLVQEKFRNRLKQ